MTDNNTNNQPHDDIIDLAKSVATLLVDIKSLQYIYEGKDTGIKLSVNTLSSDYVKLTNDLVQSVERKDSVDTIKAKATILYDDMTKSWSRANNMKEYHLYHSNPTASDFTHGKAYSNATTAITAILKDIVAIGKAHGIDAKEFTYEAMEERAFYLAHLERLGEIKRDIVNDKEAMKALRANITDMRGSVYNIEETYRITGKDMERLPRYSECKGEIERLSGILSVATDLDDTLLVEYLQENSPKITSSAWALNAMSVEPAPYKNGLPQIKYDTFNIHPHASDIFDKSQSIGMQVLGIRNEKDYLSRVDNTLAKSIAEMRDPESKSMTEQVHSKSAPLNDKIKREAPIKENETTKENKPAQQSQTAVLSSVSLIKNKAENRWELWITTTNGDNGEKFAVLPSKEDLSNFFNNARGTKEIERDRLRWGLGEKYLDMVKEDPSLKLSATTVAPSETMSQEDKMYQKFSEIMIKQLEELKVAKWQKPWKATAGGMNEAINLDGRPYNGTNSFFLTMLAADAGYKSNIWVTYNRLIQENFTESKAKGKGAKPKPKVDKDGNKLPLVHINKGEESTIVSFSKPIFFDKETHEKIDMTLEEYNQMSQAARETIAVRMARQTFRVFNIAQTNLEEARPELYKQLQDKYFPTSEQALSNNKHEHHLPVVDEMLYNDLWICPIKLEHGDEAYYSISKNEIVIPTRPQFDTDEHFYSNLFHEMSHSTGASHILTRLNTPSRFGDDDYAREELVAEMSAAFLAQKYGIAKYTKGDSVNYLKSWLGCLKKSPDFIKTVLNDVKKSTQYTTARFDKIDKEMSKGQNADYSMIAKENKEIRNKFDAGRIFGDSAAKEAGVTIPFQTFRTVQSGETFEIVYDSAHGKLTAQSPEDNTVAATVDYNYNMTPDQNLKHLKEVTEDSRGPECGRRENRIYYAWQDEFLNETRCNKINDLLKSDMNAALEYANDNAFQNGIDLECTFATWKQSESQEKVAENNDIVLVYDNHIGQYDILNKVTYQDLYDEIETGHVPSEPTADVQEICKDFAEAEWERYRSHNLIPTRQTPSGDVLYFQYNRNDDQIQAGTVTNAGLAPRFVMDYDHKVSISDNLQEFETQLSQNKELFPDEEVEEEQQETEVRSHGRGR